MDWDTYFINIAIIVKEKSKNTSTKVGAVIVGPDRQVISTGFNGFPRGIDEADQSRWQRPIKYDYVEHAERNAIYNAARHGITLRDSTLYLVGMGPPTIPCINCTKGIIQSGIIRVVGAAYKELPDRWTHDILFSKDLLAEAGIIFSEIEL